MGQDLRSIRERGHTNRQSIPAAGAGGGVSLQLLPWTAGARIPILRARPKRQPLRHCSVFQAASAHIFPK